MKRFWGSILIVALAAGLLMGTVSGVAAQDSPGNDPQRVETRRTAAVAGEDELVITESVGAFIDKGKPITHVIIVLLVIALFLVIDQLRVHFLERLRAGEIRSTDLSQVSIADFERIASTGTRSRVGRLLIDAISTYRHAGDLSLVNAEAEFFREKEEHRFNTFESRMAFLADTSGGLGLLGTVWGIYRGFAAKAVVQSNEELLAAMGVALVTTFVGIVVSVIINWMSTEVGAAVRGRIMAAIEKIEDYREILLKELANRAA
jgi:biopolymer transport protein ExbB/TolQ